MIKYLELLLELIRTKNEEDYADTKKLFLATGKKIEDREDKNLQIFHRYGFIFSAYEDLLTEKISLNDFLAIGDITSSRKLISDQKSSLDLLYDIINKSESNYKNTLIILDSISFQTLSESEKKSIQTWSKENNNELVFC